MPSERDKASFTPDQSEDDDYIRHLGNRIAALRFKFSLGTLLFIVTCLGVIFTPLQFIGLEGMPVVIGLGVMFVAIVIVLAIVITPRRHA